ncbi:MAG: copper resistance protein CopC [Candidatus Nanopelagicaceae bacterium]
MLRKLLLAVFLMIWQMPFANAHAIMVDSFPKPNSHLTEIPSVVWIEFDGSLQTFEGVDVNKLMITDVNGNRIDDGNFKVGGARVAVSVKNQAKGTIKIYYRVVSEDGHPVEGFYKFFVDGLPEMNQTSADTKKNESADNSNEPNVIKPSSIAVSNNATQTLSATSGISKQSVKINHLEHNDNFLKIHAVHIIEVIIAIIFILSWGLYRRFK